MDKPFDINLEEMQDKMLRNMLCVPETEFMEYLLFLNNFQLLLEELPYTKTGKRCWITKRIKPWLDLLSNHAKRCGFPEVMLGHLQTSCSRKSSYLLLWIITQVNKACYSTYDKIFVEKENQVKI